MARPVVVTAGALEGIDANPVTETILADTAEAVAAACCRMATTHEGAAIGEAARARIIRYYDWDVTLRQFDEMLRPRLASRRVTDRPIFRYNRNESDAS